MTCPNPISAAVRPAPFGETPADLDWETFCERVETLSGCELDSAEDFDSAYIAHRNGVTASDYALEVVARAGEFL
jgi:hypothetical protein